MIRGYCHTNLDEYKGERWPEEFVAVPRIGENVESESGKTLRVVGITHAKNGVGPGIFIRIELHH